MVCCASCHWDGPEPSEKKVVQLTYRLGSKLDYTVWVIPQGFKTTFVLDGDGGWINWAFGGPSFNRRESDGKVVDFY